MKRVYFAGKFKILEDVPFDYCLVEDYRANILGLSKNQRIITNSTIPIICEDVEYCGSFFYPSDLYDNTTKAIVESDVYSIDRCDTFIAVLENNISVGTTSELIYAAEKGKNILILYEKQKTQYAINSEYWFPIVLSKMLCDQKGSIHKAIELSVITHEEIDKNVKSFLKIKGD